MSLREIFDFIWNYPIPWLTIIGGFVILWAVVIGGGLLLLAIIGKQGAK